VNSEGGGGQRTGAELCYVMVGWKIRRKGSMEQIDTQIRNDCLKFSSLPTSFPSIFLRSVGSSLL